MLNTSCLFPFTLLKCRHQLMLKGIDLNTDEGTGDLVLTGAIGHPVGINLLIAGRIRQFKLVLGQVTQNLSILLGNAHWMSSF